MTLQQLFKKFSASHNWNALAYVAYKILFTALSFILYSRLSTEDFSIWANIHCTAYLLILWIDAGFRKSIPRYAPEYAHNKKALKQFTNGVILFQALLLIASVPIFIFVLNHIFVRPDSMLIALGCGLFVGEGITSVLQLVYHAYFWNKEFNILTTTILLAQMAFNLFFIAHTASSRTVIIGILASKIIASFVIICASIIMLKWLNKDEIDPISTPFNARLITRKFIKHSALMWASNIIKSLSERNFLVPFFTYTLGSAPANLFKVANDGALFFYRIVIKTIGTTDTALLAHVETSPENRRYMDLAFKKLISKMALLCIPLIIFVGSIFLYSQGKTNEFMLYALTTMAIAYLIESLFLPYERMLEVKQQYWYLFFCYIPYLMIIIMFLSSSIIDSLGLFESIVMIHMIRLVSLFAMVFCARRLFRVSFPARHILLILGVSLCIVGALYPLTRYLIKALETHGFNLF
jgi:hypothetical protein